MYEIKTGIAVSDQFSAFESDGYTKRSGLLSPDFTTTVYQNNSIITPAITISEIGSTGEYKTQFTPSGEGIYEVQILIQFNKDIWYGKYLSVTELTHGLSLDARDRTKRIDDTPVTSPPANGSLLDQITNKDSSRTYDPAMHSLEAIAGALVTGNQATTTNITAIQADLSRVLGLLHHNSILDKQTYDADGQLLTARLRVYDSVANIPITAGGSETVGLLQEYGIESEWAGLNIATNFVLKQIL